MHYQAPFAHTSDPFLSGVPTMVEARTARRADVALPIWLCTSDASLRGYALDLSESGARVGGVGTQLAIGDQLVAKIVLQAHEPPVVLRAEVVRQHERGPCPEICVRFLDPGVDDWFRVARFIDAR